MEYLVCMSTGYLMGSFNPSYLIAKSRGVDIHKSGSKNAGASNMVLLFGKSTGLVCAIIDILKICLAIKITKAMFRQAAYTYVFTSVACILGHIFPFYTNFKGGKGLACMIGALFMYNWKVFLCLFVLAAVIVLVSDYICFAPLALSVLFPVVYMRLEQDMLGMFLLGIVSVVMIWKHQENLRRIFKGTEVRISYLWNKEAETKRVQENMLKQGQQE